MDSNLTLADWARIFGIQATLVLILGGWMNHRMDRIEDRMYVGFGEVRTEIGDVRTELRKLGERVARIEGKIEGTPPLPTGKHITPESK